jgi:hypothetical protein
MYMYICIYVYISLLDSIPIGTVQRYVCTFKLNTYVFLVLGSTFNTLDGSQQEMEDGSCCYSTSSSKTVCHTVPMAIL